MTTSEIIEQLEFLISGIEEMKGSVPATLTEYDKAQDALKAAIDIIKEIEVNKNVQTL